MTSYRRRATREYRVALTNDTSLRVVAKDMKKAYYRAETWCDMINAEVAEGEKVSIHNIVEVED